MPDLSKEIMACIEAGAAGYVLKNASFDSLVDTIRAVHHGESVCFPRMAASLFSRIAELASERIPRLPQSALTLTARELDILKLIAKGNANKEVAAQLSIAEDTVKSHVGNILEKLGANDRTHAVTIGLKRGIIEL